MNKRIASFIGAAAGAFILNNILPEHRYLPFSFRIILLGAGALLGWGVVKVFGGKGENHSFPADFQPAFGTRNIALDTTNNRMWLNPDRGNPLVLEHSQISSWTHEWTLITAGIGMGQKRDNRIVFTIKDLSRPTLTVKFSSYRLAEEWQARLTAWKDG